MPNSAANLYSASSSHKTETPGVDSGPGAQPRVPPTHQSHHHGAGIADSTPATTLPPLTPATTTRQSVPLGVHSTLWGGTTTPTSNTHSIPLLDPSTPTIVTHAPSPEEPSSDLTSSVPSTTTTLTNTLPPTQSAALRALNAPAFQSQASSNTKNKPAKSTSSQTTLSSQPVVVRTYSGSRHNSHPSSGINTPRRFPNMNGHTSNRPSALSAGLAGRAERLPSVDDFSFSAILRAVDPEIREAIDAIAEICAKSRLSLADEYDAHLPPQGEITGAGPAWASGSGASVGRGRLAKLGQGWAGADNTLTAVPEASSSSERLAEGSRGSITAGGSRRRSQSAYGSLKSVISGGSNRRPAIKPHRSSASDGVVPQEAVPKVSAPNKHPFINLIATAQSSKQLSLDLSSTIKDVPVSRPSTAAEAATDRQTHSHRRNISTTSTASSMAYARTRSTTLSSVASWMPWARHTVDQHAQELTKAETRLREMLTQSEGSAFGRGKAAV
jgi:hypothetical protein